MKAIIQDRYGSADTLELRREPVAPRRPSLRPFRNAGSNRSQPGSRSNRQRPCPPLDRWRCRVFATRAGQLHRSGERYDLILDLVGNHPWSVCKRALTPDGTYVLSGYDQYGSSGHRWLGSLGRFARLIVVSPFVGYLHPFRGTKDPGDRSVLLKELIEARKVTPVIDRTFSLSDVSEAIRYLETGSFEGRSSSPSRDGCLSVRGGT